MNYLHLIEGLKRSSTKYDEFWTDEELQAIKERARVEWLKRKQDGMIDYGTNGGIKCDTDNGPCSCGAWH